MKRFAESPIIVVRWVTQITSWRYLTGIILMVASERIVHFNIENYIKNHDTKMDF